MRSFTKTQGCELYRRLAATRRIPQTELEFINRYLAVAVVSRGHRRSEYRRQNKATPALVAIADTGRPRCCARRRARGADDPATIGFTHQGQRKTSSRCRKMLIEAAMAAPCRQDRRGGWKNCRGGQGPRPECRDERSASAKPTMRGPIPILPGWQSHGLAAGQRTPPRSRQGSKQVPRPRNQAGGRASLA